MKNKKIRKKQKIKQQIQKNRKHTKIKNQTTTQK